ncbi:MAG: precorrin-8X methylmutase [Verrucomicrobiota bacterium]
MTVIPNTSSTEDFGIVIAGHGSRDPDGVREFEEMISLLKKRFPKKTITHGFLEFAQPTIDEAIRANVQSGSKKIAVVPGVLLAATHAKNDMPSEVLAMQKELPEIELHYGSAMELNPSILNLCRERLIEAEGKSPKTVARSETCLIVVGRGTTDSDANSQVSKLARMLEEGLGYGSSFVCYSGTADPKVSEGLKTAAKLGFKRLIVIPFFLFNGILVKRIYAAAEEMQKSRPDLEVLCAPYLGVHPTVTDLLIERAGEALAGKAAMNCSLCKYRVQIVGYEKEVGTPQQGHHHHVRGGVSLAPETPKAPAPIDLNGYVPHPIEAESFKIIEAGLDWSPYQGLTKAVLQRLVHTSGDFGIVNDIYISTHALENGLKALQSGAMILTDVTMVQSGLRRTLLDTFGLQTFCAVHDEETRLLAQAHQITRSAAGIRLAWEKFGNNVIVAIGDAPTAVEEAIRLVKEHQWRPHLIIGLPVGFVGTRECKENLRRCLNVARVTNRGTRGGSPWASSVINALLIEYANLYAKQLASQTQVSA